MSGRNLTVRVAGIGVLGPGLAGWTQASEQLCEPAGFVPAPTALPVPVRLQPSERRRSGALVKLSLAVADEALQHAERAGHGVDPAAVATVFTSSSGDTVNCVALCEALAQADRVMSPTRFTNSVHNATAGYWHIATASRAPSVSLCGFDASFAAGLLEAMAQCAATQAPVLLVASDIPYPHPMDAKRPTPDAFGVALLLVADAPESAALPGVVLASDAWSAAGTFAETAASMGHAELDRLCLGVPAARALPLLAALAAMAGGASAKKVGIEGFGGGVLTAQVVAGERV